MSRIAVVGGGGYLGQRLVDHLIAQDHEVHVYVRKNATILVRNPAARLIETKKPTEGLDVIVNLAYPSGGKIYRNMQDNAAIMDTVQWLAGPQTRIIQTSTLAVFGFGLDHEQVPALLKRRRDYPYIESKIDMEIRLSRVFESERLDIIRLGNLWGPGSPTWTVALMDKIFFGLPVSIDDEDGFSNATDVHNTISYITFLVDREDRPAGNIHHLAEFSEIKWSGWIQKIARLLNFEPVSMSSRPAYPRTIFSDLREVLISRPRTGGLLRGLWGSRFAGSYLRTLFANLPEPLATSIEKKFSSGLQGGGGDAVFYNIMSCPVRYESIYDERWSPVLDLEGSWQGVCNWAEEAGYLV